jgi:hypothetical protein
METRRQSRPASLLFLTGCLLFLIAGGWAGGLNFILDPSGASLGMDPAVIKRLFVPDYRLPGIFLLVAFGLLPAPILMALWLRPASRQLAAFSRRFHEHWAWLLALGLSLTLIGWLAFEIALMGSISAIQWGLIGFSIIFLGAVMLPSIRKYYREQV